MVGPCWINFCTYDQQEIEPFLSSHLRSVRNLVISYGLTFKRRTLTRRSHSAAQICCASSNQDLSESCWSQCSSCQQQLAELGCHILAPTPTSSTTYVAPTLTTSWGPGQTANFMKCGSRFTHTDIPLQVNSAKPMVQVKAAIHV